MQGGVSSETIDGTESVNFAFDAGSATNVIASSYLGRFTGSDNASFTVQGFGVGGTPLGSVTVGLSNFPFYNISSLFGGVPLSGFTWNGDGPGKGGYAVSVINYTPVASTPEPSSLALLGIGLAGVAGYSVGGLTHSDPQEQSAPLSHSRGGHLPFTGNSRQVVDL